MVCDDGGAPSASASAVSAAMTVREPEFSRAGDEVELERDDACGTTPTTVVAASGRRRERSRACNSTDVRRASCAACSEARAASMEPPTTTRVKK